MACEGKGQEAPAPTFEYKRLEGRIFLPEGQD